MRIGNSQVMNDIDSYCIKELAVPGVVLMENAAIKAVENIELQKKDKFTIVCGRGNNGGDGFAIARHLFVKKKEIEIFVIGSIYNMSEECRINYNIINNMGIDVKVISSKEDITILIQSIKKTDITIDCIFGTGISRKLEGIYENVINAINEEAKYILAVDVPSGFNASTGEVMGVSIKANKTVTFGLYKKGFITYGSDKYTGEIKVEDIGIPPYVIEKYHKGEFLLDEFMIKNIIHKRDKYSYKGDFGRVFIIAGSLGFTGAGFISSEAAVRSGAGLVTLGCRKDVMSILSSKVVECMTLDIEDIEKVIDAIQKSNAIAIGPGMGNNTETLDIVKLVLENAKCPVIIDADGINVLKDNLELIHNKNIPIILTPHLGEMSKITSLDIDYIKENRIEVAQNFAKEHGVIVLLKGFNTVIADGKNTYINPTGNSAMASGGMGDALTGIITSFVAQGYEPIEGTAAAAYIHGYCGEELSKSMFCVNAQHIIDNVSHYIKNLI